MADAINRLGGNAEVLAGPAGAAATRKLVRRRHAVRRADEMAAATALLGELGVPARIAAASHDWLTQLAQEGRPAT